MSRLDSQIAVGPPTKPPPHFETRFGTLSPNLYSRCRSATSPNLRVMTSNLGVWSCPRILFDLILTPKILATCFSNRIMTQTSLIYASLSLFHLAHGLLNHDAFEHGLLNPDSPAPVGNITYLFQWETQSNQTTTCTSPPHIIFGYSVSDPLKLTRVPVLETWPTFHRAWGQKYEITNNCIGPTRTKMWNNLCCISIPNPSETAKISSVALLDLKNITTDLIYLFPTVVNHQLYCNLNNMGGHFGFAYKDLYIIANQGCYEHIFKCSIDGILTIFTEPYCQGTFIELELTNLEQDFEQKMTGKFRARMVKFRETFQPIRESLNYTRNNLTDYEFDGLNSAKNLVCPI